MKKAYRLYAALFCGFIAFSSITSVLADTNKINIAVTASTAITNMPASFPLVEFMLIQPMGFGYAPSFPISDVPLTENMHINKYNNVPALALTSYAWPRDETTYVYYCDGLTFKYGKYNDATVIFTGKINISEPGSNIQCICTGSACSTTAPVHAKMEPIR